MSCFHPLTAFWRSVDRSSITFDKNKSATKIPFALPCGRCIGCRMEKARQWGLRCLHEKKLWEHNQFVTLTYNDESMPPGGSVCLRDVQLFMKRLRKLKKSNKNNPIRFFLGAEYGEENRRPHYHALLFNCSFGDKKLFGRNGRGEAVYTSEELSSVWSIDGLPMGFCTIGEVTFESAVYCAKYALKKLNVTDESSPEARQAFEDRYVVYDIDGVVHQRATEFAVMSRRPGIGMGYYEKYGAEVRAHDNVIVNGRPVRPPRYYDSKSDVVDPVGFAETKARRKREGVLAKPDNTPDRLAVKEKLAEIAASKKEKKL